MSSSARAGAASARASVAQATRIPSHLLICLNRSPAEDPSLGTIGLWIQRNMAQPAGVMRMWIPVHGGIAQTTARPRARACEPIRFYADRWCVRQELWSGGEYSG